MKSELKNNSYRQVLMEPKTLWVVAQHPTPVIMQFFNLCLELSENSERIEHYNIFLLDLVCDNQRLSGLAWSNLKILS